MEHKLYAGYSRQVVEPTESIPLGGYSNELKRFHTAMTEDICVTAVALSDENDSTILMIGADICTVGLPVAEPARKRVCQATGLPEDRVFIAATHTHSAPGLAKQELECIQKYTQQLITAMAETAVAALADRKPAKLFVGSWETRNLNFIKHYRVRDKNTGQVRIIGDQYGTSKDAFMVDHVTRVDPTVHVVRVEREGGKDIVLTNFRAHPHFTGGYKKYDLSSDYIGAFRMALEAMYDCHAVYFQGACGNVNSSTRMPDERLYTTCRSHGTGLAAEVLECLGRYMKEVEPAQIKTKQVTVYGEINKPDEKLADAARMVRKIWAETYDRDLCVEKGWDLGIHSPYHAGALLANLNRTKEEHGGMILNAVTLGKELAFVTFPGEMYDSISVRMEDNSPFATTLMLGYCYHHIGYLPSAQAYKYGSYEVDVTRMAPGTGEMVADTYVEMLKELKDTEKP